MLLPSNSGSPERAATASCDLSGRSSRSWVLMITSHIFMYFIVHLPHLFGTHKFLRVEYYCQLRCINICMLLLDWSPACFHVSPNSALQEVMVSYWPNLLHQDHEGFEEEEFHVFVRLVRIFKYGLQSEIPGVEIKYLPSYHSHTQVTRGIVPVNASLQLWINKKCINTRWLTAYLKIPLTITGFHSSVSNNIP